MPHHTAPAAASTDADDDPTLAWLLDLHARLTKTAGAPAAQTLVDLVALCQPAHRDAHADLAAELHTGLLALERGDWAPVRARLDELANACRID